MIRVLLLCVALVFVAVSDTPAKFRFVQPARTLILSGPRGVWYHAQVYIPRHVDNRQASIVWDGEGCHGEISRSMDGENESAIFPLTPVKVEATPGICSMAAILYGPGGKVRARVDLEVRVCGGEADGCLSATPAGPLPSRQ